MIEHKAAHLNPQKNRTLKQKNRTLRKCFSRKPQVILSSFVEWINVQTGKEVIFELYFI